MTDQQPLQPNIAELGAKFGETQAQAYAQIITLEKQLAAQAMTIQQMTQNEARLVDHIQELEAKISEFTQQEYDFADHIQEIETELIELKIELKKSLEINDPYRETEQSVMSPAAQQLAQQGKEAIEATKKPPA